MIKVDTKNILFICGGAFSGINKAIARRMNTQVIGFSNDEGEKIDRENLLQYITQQDLKSFGLIPELIGRLPVLTYLEPLNKETLRLILTEPKNALLKQYSRLFEIEGIKLTFTEEALDLVTTKAMEYKLGARGLRSICEAILTDAMFELPSHRDIEVFEVDATYVSEKLSKSKLDKLKVA